MKYPEDFVNKIIQGDCLDVMRQMPDKSVDLILTDPPYGIHYISKHYKGIRPHELICRMITTGSDEGNIILDPFLGSGTTAEACKLMHRNYIGIEISPDYCKIAEERLRQKVFDFPG